MHYVLIFSVLSHPLPLSGGRTYELLDPDRVKEFKTKLILHCYTTFCLILQYVIILYCLNVVFMLRYPRYPHDDSDDFMALADDTIAIQTISRGKCQLSDFYPVRSYSGRTYKLLDPERVQEMESKMHNHGHVVFIPYQMPLR